MLNITLVKSSWGCRRKLFPFCLTRSVVLASIENPCTWSGLIWSASCDILRFHALPCAFVLHKHLLLANSCDVARLCAIDLARANSRRFYMLADCMFSSRLQALDLIASFIIICSVILLPTEHPQIALRAPRHNPSSWPI